MPIIRIDELPDGDNNLTSDDILPFMDDPSGISVTKKASVETLIESITSNAGFDAAFDNIGMDLTLIVNSDNTVSGYALTSIGSNQFDYNTGIGLRIGNSVTSIGNYAFQNCSGFTGSLTIGSSVASIGNYAFRYCGFTDSLTIGNSVTSIGSYAFGYCSGFTGSLIIPDSLTSISNGTFYNCSGFTGSLTIPDSVTSIGSGAFAACSGLTGFLTIPNSVISVGDNAFAESGFTSVNSYVTRTIINQTNVFLYCTNLTTIHAQASDVTWTAGADTIGGKAVTVIKDL